MPHKRKDLNIKGANLWCFVGLIASDGSLSSDVRHIDITSKDGDGGLQKWAHNTNKREQWNLRITSASKKFLEWIQSKIENIIEVKGKLYAQSPTQFKLKYGKMAARVIAEKCYQEGCFGLERKVRLARDCIDSYKGWNKSKTVNLARQ